MKVKLLTDDFSFDSNGERYEKPLDERINDFIKDKKVVDIKYSSNISSYCTEDYHGFDQSATALVMYEDESTQIKQKSFGGLASDEDINNFTKQHDVIRIEHFQSKDADVTTIITYKEDNK